MFPGKLMCKSVVKIMLLGSWKDKCGKILKIRSLLFHFIGAPKFRIDSRENKVSQRTQNNIEQINGATAKRVGLLPCRVNESLITLSPLRGEAENVRHTLSWLFRDLLFRCHCVVVL